MESWSCFSHRSNRVSWSALVKRSSQTHKGKIVVLEFSIFYLFILYIYLHIYLLIYILVYFFKLFIHSFESHTSKIYIFISIELVEYRSVGHYSAPAIYTFPALFISSGLTRVPSIFSRSFRSSIFVYNHFF